MIVSETEIEVRYYETDLMGIVHHSNYIRYFECGRHRLLVDYGLPIEKIEAAGIMLPVAHVECNYKIPARMGDILRVVSTIKTKPLARIIVDSQIYNQHNELVCTGKVMLGFIHSDTRKPTRAPKIFTDVFDRYFD